MGPRIVKSVIPVFAATFIVSLLGCSNIPNPFSTSYPVMTLPTYGYEVKLLYLEPASIHPGEKVYLKGTLHSTPSATISLKVVDVKQSTATIPLLVESRVVPIPEEGVFLGEEFSAPSNVGTYSIVIQSGHGSTERHFEVTPQ